MRPQPRFRRSLTQSGTLSIVALLGAAVSGPLTAAEDDDKTAPKSCLYQAELRSTDIVDDRTILFTTRNGQAYSNALPRQCPSLRRNSLLSYTFEGRRLCAGSLFQLLEDMGGRRVPTFFCPLGNFVPISQDEAEDLIRTARDRPDGRRSKRGERDRVRIEPADVAAPAPSAAPSPAPSSPPQ
jgi:hypothetical protein